MQKINTYSFSFILVCALFTRCNDLKKKEQFNCYADAINLLYTTHHVDTVYIAKNFPNFKVNEGKFPEQIFYYNELNENQDEYLEIIPNNHFWHFHLLNKVKTVFNKRNDKEVHFSRFNYSLDMPLTNSVNYDRIFLVFSPIYYHVEDNIGFFIVSEINNIRISSTKIFYVFKNNNSYEICDQINIDRFMPY